MEQGIKLFSCNGRLIQGENNGKISKSLYGRLTQLIETVTISWSMTF